MHLNTLKWSNKKRGAVRGADREERDTELILARREATEANKMMMMMMKNPIVLVACILLFSSLTVLASDSTFGPDKCCFKFVSKALPKKRVVSYTHTDNLCSMEGVLFKMMKGNEICADPTQQWVKRLMEAVDTQTRRETNTTPSTTE